MRFFAAFIVVLGIAAAAAGFAYIHPAVGLIGGGVALVGFGLFVDDGKEPA